MKIKRLVRELRRKLRKDEDTPSARLKLAALYRENGQGEEAIELYLDVALEYRKLDRIAQAIAVCRSALDIDPENGEIQALMAELERLREAKPPANKGRAATASAERSDGAAVEDDVRSWAPSLVSPSRPAPSRPEASRSEAPPSAAPAADKAREEVDDQAEAGARAAVPQQRGDDASGEHASREEDVSAAHLSRSLLTPTPLPAPLPPHEADDDSMELGHLLIHPAPAGPLPGISLPGDLAPLDDDLFDLPPPADMDESLPEALRDMAPFDPDADAEDGPTQLGTPPGGVPVAEDAFRDEDTDSPPGALPSSFLESGFSAPHEGATGNEELTWLKEPMERARSEPEPVLFSGSADGHFLAAGGEEEDLALRDTMLSSVAAVDQDGGTAAAVPGARDGVPEPALEPLLSDGAPQAVVDEDKTMRQAIPGVFLPGVPAPTPTAAAGGSLLGMLLAAFDTLPAEVVRDLAERVTLRSYEGGEEVFRAGDPGDACFVVASGELRGLRRDPFMPGEPSVEVSRWGAGALFGELALLADRRRHASVQTVGPCRVYEIPRRLLRELAATYSEVGARLDALYRERLLAMLIDTAPFLNTLPGQRRLDIQNRFQTVRLDSGEPILLEGTSDGGLYLVVQGSVEVTKRVSAKRSTLLATFVEGAYFGDMSLSEGGDASASVTAAGPVELAVLPPDEFLGVVAESPGVWAQIRQTARRRELESNELLTGETPMV